MTVGTYYQKTAEVRAAKFRTNNERGNVNMNDVCIAVNQGRPRDAEYHCWHNGTSIFVKTPGEALMANVGDWIVWHINGSVDVRSESDFKESFEEAGGVYASYADPTAEGPR